MRIRGFTHRNPRPRVLELGSEELEREERPYERHSLESRSVRDPRAWLTANGGNSPNRSRANDVSPADSIAEETVRGRMFRDALVPLPAHPGSNDKLDVVEHVERVGSRR